MKRPNPERLAWHILLSAFFIFLVLCGGTVYGIQWFIFQSTVNLSAELTVARGTPRVILPNTDQPIAVTDRLVDLGNNFVVLTDSTSQATLVLSDPRTEKPVASLTLFRDSEAKLVEARAPRFGLNTMPYRIQVESSTGHSEILILQNDRRGAILDLLSPQAASRITGHGQYIFDVSDQETRVTTRSGHAVVTKRDTGGKLTLTDNYRTIVDGDGPLALLDAEQSLAINNTFTESRDIGWSFYNDREPPGSAYNTVFGGRSVVAVDRSQTKYPNQNLGHGETGLVQFLDVDVSQYSYLEIRAAFYIDEQSLSTCGVAGSECPLMIQMVYLDLEGQEWTFIHGFYAEHDPALAYPVTCATCRFEHERLNLQSWYTYESGNIMAILPAEQQPVLVKKISFYASGHAYKVYVSEMSLLASE